jgi:hypothetical protein
MAARLSKFFNGLRITIQFWLLNHRVEQLRKAILKNSAKLRNHPRSK